MFAVVVAHGLLQCGQAVVYLFVNRHVYLSRRSPYHDDAAKLLLSLETAYILAQSLNHLPSCGTVFHVVAVQTLGIVLVESSLHRYYLLKLIAHGVDVFLLEHLGIHGSLICVLGINVPCGKLYVVEIGDRHNLAHVQILLVGTLAYAYLVVLCH